MFWMLWQDYGISWDIVKTELKNQILKPLLSRWAMVPLQIQAIILIIPTFSFLLWFSLQRPVYSKITDDSTAEDSHSGEKAGKRQVR